MLKKIIENVFGDLPSNCFICKNWQSRAICNECIRNFTQEQNRCITCSKILPDNLYTNIPQCGECIKSEIFHEKCYISVSYNWPWSDLIAQLKFGNQVGHAIALANVMLQNENISKEVNLADIILPMPLSIEKLVKRGYNHALLLSKALSSKKTKFDILLKIRDTPAQSNLDKKERLKNLKGAFAIDPAKISAIKNKNILLIDDVITTGTTICEAAKVIKQAGAKSVIVAALARTDFE